MRACQAGASLVCLYLPNFGLNKKDVMANKYKMKTHNGARRRFKITGTGLILRTKGGKSHFRRRKPLRVKQAFDKMFVLEPGQVRIVKRTLPYGSPD